MAEINKDNANMEFPLQIARQYGAPLDMYSVFYSKAEAEAYAADSPLSYAGQLVTVVDENVGTVETFKITPSGTLSPVSESVTVDAELSTVSVNPVQNRVLTTALNGKYSPDNPPPSISPGTSMPLMDGTASAGTATEYARANHRHPSDSSKSAVKANGTVKSSVNFQLVGTQLTITVE